ncbi:aspartate aminotransferase family protein [Actinoallomurus sp. WRP6H-15]|nr:aspartate aminotransferase family protein [Actinoallomurus soli]MCO5967615.1 aspartate aminotransferase family protein [Actinoallomurus soli]
MLGADTAELYRSLVAAGADRVAGRIASADRPFTGIAPDRLAEEVAAVDLDRPLGDATAALDELDDLYLRDAVYFHHPRYLAHLNCPVALPALLGEAVLSAVNSSLDTWDQSAGGTLIERRLIDWTAGRLGLGPVADGVFTSGGTQSNLQALLLAREEALGRPPAEEASLCPPGGEALGRPPARADVLPRLRVLASAHGHFSVVKAARLLGLSEDAVIEVPCDRDRRMRPGALARALDRCRRQGLVPMAVVATAGTTDFGGIDPLPEIAGLCAQAGAWLHVDAAYGCGLLVSRRRHLLDGVERADSVTVDYHKSFFQPVSSSAVLVRDGAVLRHVTYHADYLNPARSAALGVPNQVDKSLQTTRRFDALKLWLTLRIMGADAVGELFDTVLDRAAEAWALLDADPRFEVVVRPRLSTLVFRYTSPGASAAALDRANLRAAAALSASGAAVVATTVVDGRHHLKFTLLNPRTTIRDIADVLDLLAGHARDHLGDDLAHAS